MGSRKAELLPWVEKAIDFLSSRATTRSKSEEELPRAKLVGHIKQNTGQDTKYKEQPALQEAVELLEPRINNKYPDVLPGFLRIKEMIIDPGRLRAGPSDLIYGAVYPRRPSSKTVLYLDSSILDNLRELAKTLLHESAELSGKTHAESLLLEKEFDSKEANLISSDTPKTGLTDEVQLVWETMTCRAMRNYYEEDGHPCKWFSRYGPFPAYAWIEKFPQTKKDQTLEVKYAGKRYQVPELLSGCRKAPIMSIGINPNLTAFHKYRIKKSPGGEVTDKTKITIEEYGLRKIYPYFDNIKQYAEHFRKRTIYTHLIAKEVFFNNEVNQEFIYEIGKSLTIKQEVVKMYTAYRDILQLFGKKAGFSKAKMELGEDVSYYNMIACGSPKWATGIEEEGGIPDEAIRNGLIEACFKQRGYLKRQIVQSNPKVLIMFGQPIADAFIAEFKDDFIGSAPALGTRISDLIQQNNFAVKFNESRIRVIFSPHASGSALYNDPKLRCQERIVEALLEELGPGKLELDSRTKHLKRTEGPCHFCVNDLYQIEDGCMYGKLGQEDKQGSKEGIKGGLVTREIFLGWVKRNESRKCLEGLRDFVKAYQVNAPRIFKDQYLPYLQANAPPEAINALLVRMLKAPELSSLYDGENRINILIGTLGDNDPQISSSSLEELVKIGPSAVGSLELALENKGLKFRLSIIEVLTRIPDERIAGILEKRLEDPVETPEIQGAVVKALGKIGNRDSLEKLKGSVFISRYICTIAVRTLKDLAMKGNSPAVEVLLDIVKLLNTNLSMFSAAEDAADGDQNEVTISAEKIEQRVQRCKFHQYIASEIKEAIIAIGPSIADAIISVLKDEKILQDEDCECGVRILARILSKIIDKHKCVEILRELLQIMERLHTDLWISAKNNTPEIKSKKDGARCNVEGLFIDIIDALGDIDTEESIELLKGIIRNNPLGWYSHPREWAMRSLVQIGTPQAIKTIIELLLEEIRELKYDDSSNVVLTAVDYLKQHMGDKEV
ncbi:MAG: HEAT repeat domain-containing protein, partial [Candidatus Omnitrophica bacterium]|nr:HEAT repeat domain-containing protein [Candidatus Omnitrophota bacterium]